MVDVFAAQPTFLLAISFSIISGLLIGIERESRKKDAGISTHIFVIAGAMYYTYLSGMVDPASKSRIAAQIVTGIGFLGAGLILKDGLTVKNLTTAASIWFAAALGMAYGYGYYIHGLVGTALAIVVPRIPKIDKIMEGGLIKKKQ